MLGNEYWMAAERRLLAIIRNYSRLQTFGEEILRMLQYDRHALLLQIDQILATQSQPLAKGRFLQRSEYLVHRSHVRLQSARSIPC